MTRCGRLKRGARTQSASSPGWAPRPNASASAPRSFKSRLARPALTAMTAATLDRLSHERLLLGLGVSGPQVIEGWHGVPYGKPLARTREAIAIIRRVLERKEPLIWDGETYRIPHEGGTGLGKPLKLMMAPMRPGYPDLSRRHRTEERGARRRARRRLASGLLFALSSREFPRSARARLRQAHAGARRARFRRRAERPSRDRGRSGALPQ